MSKICKHKFQPRYNKKWTTAIEEIANNKACEKINTEGSLMTSPYLKEETYIYDICVKCGDVKKGARK